MGNGILLANTVLLSYTNFKTFGKMYSQGAKNAFKNASDSVLKAVDEFASSLGVAFQIRDDILDCTGTVEELGKPIGSDEAEDKNTYVKLLGLERSKELVAEYSQKAISALDVFGDRAEFLKWLADYLINRNS